MTTELSSLATAEMTQLLDALAMVVPEKSAVLVSGPVFSGARRYGQDAMETENIRRRNAHDMEQLAAELRTRQPRPVISPAGFRVAGWRGRDYGRFFRRVIERFAAEVRFLDGWEFSAGSVGEMAACIEWGIPRCDVRGEPIDPAAALAQARSALDAAAAGGGDCTSLRDAVHMLEQIAD